MANDQAPAGGNQRLLALDAFRGMTILGMILVNNPGTWGHMYWPLDHAEWFGWTPTDLIFPFFLFIVGTALAYSLRKYRDGAVVSSAVYWRIVRRTVTLMLLGWGAGVFSKLLGKYLGGVPFDLSTLRLTGVLVRIAIVYFAASLIVLHMPVRGQVVLALIFLLGYWALLRWTPNPDDPTANLKAESNIVRVVDRAVIGPKHLYSDPTDPEGLLSDLPSIVTCLLGYWIGLFIQQSGVSWNTVAKLVAYGVLCAAVGWGWSYWLPIGKKLWTSSFVLFTGGLAMIALAGCLALFDVAGWKRLARPFEIVGVNAIFVFVASGLAAIVMRWTHIGGLGTHEWLYQKGFAEHIANPNLSSLAMALATVAFWWIVLWIMSLLKISVRV